MPTDLPGSRLRLRASGWRAALRRRALLDGGARLLSLAALGLAAAVWLDQAATLPRPARQALLAAWTAALAAGAWRWLLAPWRGLTFTAALEEASVSLPELRLYLRSAWELSAGAPPGTSEQLRDAHVRDAERRLESARREPDLRWRPARPLLAAAGAAVLASGSLALAPQGALSRLLRPWSDAPLERYLSVTPGDGRADWGRPVTITATWLPAAPAGRARHELTLWLKPEGGGWRRAAWDKAAGDEHRFTADELTAPLRYRLAWRDLETRDYELTPVLAPLLESVRARVHGGDSVSAPLTPAEPLTVMRGALVTVSGRPNQPLARALLKLSSQPQALPMKENASGEYEASFVAQEDAALRFELQTPDGREDRDAPAYSLKTVADQPPVIELLSPLEPVLGSPADSVPLAYAAKDDGGLTKISLILKSAGRAPVELVLQKPGGRREAAGDYALELSSLPQGRTEFQLKAVDNASPPQTGFSAKGSIDVQDLQAQHARTQQAWAKAESSVKPAAERSAKIRDALAGGKPAESQDLDALPQEWSKAAQDLDQLAQSMKQDAYSNQALAEEAQSAADALKQAGREEMSAAQESARAGASPDAAQKSDKLARRMAQAKRMLELGRRLQGMQDFYQETGRIAQKGASIESQMEALANGAKPSPEQMKKLDAELSKIKEQMAQLQKALESLPKATPQDAAAQNAMEMPVGEAREAAEELAKAIAAGDYEKAAKLARKLSESLSKIQQAVGQAAASSTSGQLPPQARQRAEEAQRKWSQLAEDQSKLIERTQKLEDSKVARRIEEQKKLLAELAQRQAVAVSSAAAQRSFPLDALAQMKAAQSEFEAKKVQSAPSLLRSAAARSRGTGFPGIGQLETDIADALQDAAQPQAGKQGSSEGGADAEQAGRDQAQLKARAGELQGELRSLADETGGSADEALDALSGAQGEQGAAAEALGRRDSAAALPRQQKALELLTQGQQQMSGGGSGGGAQHRQALIEPFKRPSGAVRMRGGGGQNGAQMGFVPLPSEREYAPPKELREELERSLRENRPASQDALIKEYFKRIAQ